MNVISVSPPSVEHYWREASPMVAEAIRLGRCRFSLDGIEDDLIAGKKRLWVVLSGETMVAAVVSCVTDFPEKRVCTMLLCGGRDVDSWVARVTKAIEEYAQWEACAEVEIIGRPGWGRKCPDYEMAGTWLVKELSQ